MLPISESAYVHGKVEDNKNILVGMGGGFVAEMPIENAIKFYEGRMSNRKGELVKVRQALG